MNNNAKTLLHYLFKILYAEFIIDKPALGLSKTLEMQKCRSNILTRIETQPGIYNITNEENTMKIVVNSGLIDDHTDHYLLTIHSNGTTYKVEKIIYPVGDITLRTIINYRYE